MQRVAGDVPVAIAGAGSAASLGIEEEEVTLATKEDGPVELLPRARTAGVVLGGGAMPSVVRTDVCEGEAPEADAEVLGGTKVLEGRATGERWEAATAGERTVAPGAALADLGREPSEGSFLPRFRVCGIYMEGDMVVRDFERERKRRKASSW